jgi:hypothetical protein
MDHTNTTGSGILGGAIGGTSAQAKWHFVQRDTCSCPRCPSCGGRIVRPLQGVPYVPSQQYPYPWYPPITWSIEPGTITCGPPPLTAMYGGEVPS